MAFAVTVGVVEADVILKATGRNVAIGKKGGERNLVGNNLGGSLVPYIDFPEAAQIPLYE